jgi:hypothetical protein
MENYSRITIETPRGMLIDLVNDRSQVVHEFFILSKDLPKVVSRVRELGQDTVDKEVGRLLRSEGLIQRQPKDSE